MRVIASMNLLEACLTKEEYLNVENNGLKLSLLRKEEKIENLKAENKYLQEQIRELKRAQFGKSSEAWVNPEQRRFDEAEFEATQNTDLLGEESSDSEPEADPGELVSVDSHKKRKGHRKALPKYLPREKVVIELPADECKDADGNGLKIIGYEVAEKLHYEPAKTRVIETHRAKYGIDSGDYVKTAPPAPAIIPKGIATPSLLAAVTVSKYADGLPLYRLEEIFKRQDIDLSRSTMGRWIIKCAAACLPLWNVLSERLHESFYVACDETRTQVLKEAGRLAESQSWMWVRSTPFGKNKIVLFDYNPSRSQEVVNQLFAGFEGFVQADGLGSYNVLDKTDGITRIGCNMHGRRYFEKALTIGAKEGKTLAEQAMKFYNDLYKIEDECREFIPQERFEYRQNKASPLWDEFKSWSEKNTKKAPEQSKIGKAFSYFNSEFEHLTGYLKDGRLEADNGFTERAIRKFAIGRNNWIFSDTVDGANASALFYSLIITAKINAVNPHKALDHIFTEIPKAKSVEDYEHLADIIVGAQSMPCP
jgi:transposase